MVELIEQSQLAVDQLIDMLGRASVEAVLQLLPPFIRTIALGVTSKSSKRGTIAAELAGWRCTSAVSSETYSKTYVLTISFDPAYETPNVLRS